VTLLELKAKVDAALLFGDMESMKDHAEITDAEIVLAIGDHPAYFNLVGK